MGRDPEVQSSVQAFVSRVSDGSGINTSEDRGTHGKSSKNGLNEKKRMLRSGFEPESLARKAVREIIDYKKTKEGFIRWMNMRCSIGHVNALISYLDKYLTEQVSNPDRLFEIIGKVDKGKRHFCMGIRDLLNYYETFSLMEDAGLIKYRKVVKIPRTNVDNYIPENEKVISAFQQIEDERYQLLFKVLVFSGLRFKEALYLLNNFNMGRLIIINNSIARYPLNLTRGTKRAFYAYVPQPFAAGLRRMDLEEEGARRYIGRRMPSKYLRKWQYNFLISHNVPESVADFIQGRAPSTVGSMHYLAKVKQADEWYAKVVPELLSLFPSAEANEYVCKPSGSRIENGE